jgi:gamma-glutamyltranspeptidase/glutathione hydrolase
VSRRPSANGLETDLDVVKLPRPQRVGASPHGCVSTQHWLATRAGVEMLREGGNAMDAAVAAAFALGVVEPAASGLGGQTMMLVHDAAQRRTTALDGSSRAPHRAVPSSLSEAQRRRGHAATTVPSTPAVLDHALRRWGSLPLARVLEPSIRLAAEGYPVSELQHRLTVRERKALREHGAGAVFLRDGRRARAVGEVFRQDALASTLRRIAERGVEDVYLGAIARAIDDDMSRHGGILRLDDLAQVPWPVERRPLACRYDGLRVLTFPEPGAGRTLVEMLHLLEQFPEKLRTPDTPRGARLLCEVIRQANLDRHDRPFDAQQYAQVQDRRMSSPDYAEEVARRLKRRMRPRRRRPPASHGETTHLSTMDAAGNVVALTQSIERVYGSCAASPELGFLYNDYLSAFDHEDISHPYHLRPNAVPWASVAPTIVFKGRRPWLALGSPGSERITSAMVQVVMRLARQSPLDAVVAPRLHCSRDGKVSLEAARMRDDIPDSLVEAGFTVDARDPYSFYLGCVQLVAREGADVVGVADPRRDGEAGGPRRVRRPEPPAADAPA